ncbi:MAG: glycosyltransferase family 39 protein [candidate division WOR-3 bacterium]
MFSVLLFDPKLSTGGDDAVYLILGRALATGKGYSEINLPGSPPHTLYPFGLPLVLALVHLVAGSASVIVSKVVVVIFGLLALFFAYRVFEQVLHEYAPLAGALFVSLPVLYEHSHHVFTEVPFLCLSMAAVWLLADVEKAGPEQVAAGFACAVGALALRSAGIALAVAILAYLLVRRWFLYAGMFGLLAGVFLLAWSIRNASVGAGSGYLEQFLARNPYVKEAGQIGLADFLVRIGHNLKVYTLVATPRTVVALLAGGSGRTVVGLALAGLGVVGLLVRLRRPSVVEFYAVPGGVVLLSWPQVWASPRFLLPLVPLVLVYVCLGACWLAQRVRLSGAVPVVLVLVAGSNLIALGRQSVSAVRDNIGFLRGDRLAGYPDDWRRYFDCIDWIGHNTAADAVVLARKPEYVYLVSGRRSFCFPFSADESEVLVALMRSDYVLIDNFRWAGTTAAVLGPVLESHPEEYELVYRSAPPEAYVLRMKRGRLGFRGNASRWLSRVMPAWTKNARAAESKS